MACGPGYIRMSFDQTNPEAQRWARDRSARLVREVTADTRVAIRAVIEQAFSEGLPPREAAKLIRSTVGLTQRDALAVMRRQVKLMAEGMSASRAQAAAEKYANKLHRARALTIARTETMSASNQGQQELWNQAIRARLLGRRSMKTWLVADPCPICEPFEDETVRVDANFSIGHNPPAHPNCRCTIGIVEVRE